LYHGIDVEGIRRVSDLPRLPFTDRAMLAAAPSRFLAEGITPTYLQFTSGTTGVPLLVWRCQEERVAIARLLGDEQPPAGDMPLALALRELHHGTATPIPGHHLVIEGSIADERTVEQALELLLHAFSIPGLERRVTVVTGTDTALRAVAHYAALRGVPLADRSLAVIQSYGDLMPRAVREGLSRAWGTPLVDRWSCTEHFGGASSIPGTDVYRFDPHLVPEVVDIRSGAPIHSGTGALVVTSLYPLVQCMPLIRYRTGDLVEVVQSDPERGSLMVRMHGRESRAALWNSPLLTEMEARNAIEELPGVVYRTRRRELRAPGIARAIGHPDLEVRLEEDSDGRRVVVEVRVERESDDLRRTLRTVLLEESPSLARAVGAGLELELSFRHDDRLTCTGASNST
jgi:hypothetical protein